MKHASALDARAAVSKPLYGQVRELLLGRNGAGFSDVGVTRVQRARSDVGEAPRHEIAGRKGAGGEAGAMGI